MLGGRTQPGLLYCVKNTQNTAKHTSMRKLSNSGRPPGRKPTTPRDIPSRQARTGSVPERCRPRWLACAGTAMVGLKKTHLLSAGLSTGTVQERHRPAHLFGPASMTSDGQPTLKPMSAQYMNRAGPNGQHGLA